MKRTTLLAIAVTSAFASGVSSAQTFLCSTPSDMSYTSCAQVTLDAAGGPAVVTSYAVEPRSAAENSAAIEQVRSAARIVPGTPDRTVTITTYSNSWPDTEPSVSTYHYSYGPWVYY